MEADMEKTWTIMVYFAADNNLGEEVIWSIQDIHDVEATLPNVKVVELFDGGGPSVTFGPNKLAGLMGQRGIMRVPPRGSRIVEAVSIAIDKKRGSNQNVVSIGKTLEDLIVKNSSAPPTDHYMVVLSGHGSGVVGEFLTTDKRLLGLSIPRLRKVLDSALQKIQKKLGQNAPKKFDILGLDSCQMSMVEVAYEVRKQVKYLVGAEGFEPTTGWPYERILPLLNTPQNGNDPDQFAGNIVKEYIQYYFPYTAADLSTNASALNISNIGTVVEKLKEFTTTLKVASETKAEREERLSLSREKLSEELKRRIDRSELSDPALLDAIVLSHRDAQGYKDEQYTDIWDFCDLLSARLEDLKLKFRKRAKIYDKLKKKCEELRDSIDPKEQRPGESAVKFEERRKAALVLRSGYVGPKFQHSHGLSVLFPWATLTDAAGTADLDHYQLLDFAQDTAWDEFLRLYHRATIRPPRELNTEDEVFPSLLNRRSGLFAPIGKDPEVDPTQDPEINPLDATGKFGTLKIASMKNPPIEWRKCKL